VGRALAHRGGATRGFCPQLCPRWSHAWRETVASGHRLLRSNFLRILRTPLGRVATDYGPSAVSPEGAFAPKVAADPKAPFLNHKSPSQRAKEEGVFRDPLHRSADSVVVDYCVEVWGWAWPLVTLARRDQGHARHIGGDGAVHRRRRQGAGSRVGGLILLAFISPTGALQALQALHKCSRLHRNYKV
jgi:hypothetical protein